MKPFAAEEKVVAGPIVKKFWDSIDKEDVFWEDMLSELAEKLPDGEARKFISTLNKVLKAAETLIVGGNVLLDRDGDMTKLLWQARAYLDKGPRPLVYILRSVVEGYLEEWLMAFGAATEKKEFENEISGALAEITERVTRATKKKNEAGNTDSPKTEPAP